MITLASPSEPAFGFSNAGLAMWDRKVAEMHARQAAGVTLAARTAPPAAARPVVVTPALVAQVAAELARQRTVAVAAVEARRRATAQLMMRNARGYVLPI